MANSGCILASISVSRLPRRSIVNLAFLLAFAMFALQSAQAQTLTVLHTFTRGQDGAAPRGGLTIDRAGNLYGTATQGGSTNCQGGCGTVFKLSLRNSNWTFSPLYLFNGAPDGADPEGRLIFGSDGRLYGTTGEGGRLNSNGDCSSIGCGTIFALQPPASFCRSITCYWSEAQLYQFNGVPDGAQPTGDTVFDTSGNFYGTTYSAGAFGAGTVYELSPSGGNWTETLIHTFMGPDGQQPYGGLTLDPSGNLYGATELGGQFPHAGLVFELTNAGSGWNETVLHNFNGTDGDEPLGGLILDASGNVYGTTNHGGQGGGGGGKAFELTPSGGSWTLDLLYGFNGIAGPWGDLVMDSSGNIYGTTVQDGMGFGSIFKLTYSNGNWIFTDLHDFDGEDGANPHGSLVFDASGNLYGITTGGGSGNSGVVWELTP